MSYTHPIWDFNTYTYGYIRPRLVDNLSVASDNTPQYSGPNCWSPFGENRSVKRIHIQSNMPFPIFMFSTSSRTFNFDLSGGTLESNKQRQVDDGEEMSEGIRALVTCLIRAFGLTKSSPFSVGDNKELQEPKQVWGRFIPKVGDIQLRFCVHKFVCFSEAKTRCRSPSKRTNNRRASAAAVLNSKGLRKLIGSPGCLLLRMRLSNLRQVFRQTRQTTQWPSRKRWSRRKQAPAKSSTGRNQRNHHQNFQLKKGRQDGSTRTDDGQWTQRRWKEDRKLMDGWFCKEFENFYKVHFQHDCERNQSLHSKVCTTCPAMSKMG